MVWCPELCGRGEEKLDREQTAVVEGLGDLQGDGAGLVEEL